MPGHSVDDLARSFERHLRAGNKSPGTVEAYLEAVTQFAAYLRAHRRASNSPATLQVSPLFVMTEREIGQTAGALAAALGGEAIGWWATMQWRRARRCGRASRCAARLGRR